MRRAIQSITNAVSYRAGPKLGYLEQILQNQSIHHIHGESYHFPRHHYGEAIISRSLWSVMSPASTPREDLDGSHQAADIQMPSRKNVTRPRDCEREIVQLLNVPNSAILDAATWVKADACTQEAAENRDFILAFDLLDRMARDPNAAREMNTEIIFTVVEHWLFAYEKFQKSPITKTSNYLYSPISVWRRIEKYLEAGIPIESRTLHRILESTAMVKSKKLNGPSLAEAILEKMISMSKLQHPDIRPSTYTFNAVIASWEAAAATSSPKSQLVLEEAPKRGYQLLERLKGLYAAGWGEELMPDRQSFRRVMNIFAHRGDGDQVEALLEELYELYLEHGYTTLLPTTNMFSLVLYAWSKSRDPIAAERATTILDHMLEMEKNKTLPGLKVTPFCFNIVMVCWSKQRSKESTQKVQTVFDRMVALSASDPSKRPIPGSYAALIYAWSFHDPRKAEEAFWAWKAEHNAGKCDMRIDNRLFSSLVSGWFHSTDPDAAMRCDKLLQHALDGNLGKAWQPQAVDFNMVINAYCRRCNMKEIERAEAVLEQMNDCMQSSQGFAGPSLTSYIPIIHALTRLGKVDRADMLLRQCFDREQGHSDSADRMDTTQGCKKKQNTRTFNRVLKTWLVKAPVFPEAAQRAEDLLLQMEGWGVKPNFASFQYVLECRKKSRKEHGVMEKAGLLERANQILTLLDREYETGALHADKSCYLSTRREWALEAI